MSHFVVSSCGRSGSMFTWRALNWLGFRTSFEEFFRGHQVRPLHCSEDFLQWLEETGTRGEVSSMSTPFAVHMPKEVTVVHLVRNPVAVIASLLGVGNFKKPLVWSPGVKFNFRYVPEMQYTDSPMVLAMKYWLYWNKMIELRADYRYRSEDLANLETGELASLVTSLGGLYDSGAAEEAINHLGITWNAGKRDMSVRWERLPECNGLKAEIEEAAYRYGYTELELYKYCPHCGLIMEKKHEQPL